jgi:HEAT repeat protein
MKAPIAGLFLLLAAGSSWGQIANLSGAEVTDNVSISDPATMARKLDDSWLAFRMPVLDDTTSPCCWKGNWNQFGESGCSLASRQNSYGSRSDAPITENLVVFARVNRDEVLSMRVVGEQCPVEGDGAKVEWLGEVDDEAGLDWLEAVARSDDPESVRHSALYAMALHRDEAVTQRLSLMARDSDSKLQRESIFWLGEARGTAGLGQLEQLLDELPRGDLRRELNFAIAQTGTPAASDLLTAISQTDTDPEQRSGALFWLAQEFPEQARQILKNVLVEEQDSEVLEQAVFAISQLPDDMSGPMLLELARDNQAPREVRRQALFWIAQSDDEKTIAALADLLTRQP